MTIFTQKDAGVFIQFRLGDNLYYLGDCIDLDSIPNPRFGGIDLIQCWTGRRDGFKVLAKKYSEPSPIEFSITDLISEVQSWLEQVKCPFTLYALQTTCGDRGVARNWQRGRIVYGCDIQEDTVGNLANHKGSDESTLETKIVASPPRVDVIALQTSREVTAEAQAANGIAMANNLFCDDNCGAYVLPCDRIIVPCDALGGATADLIRSTNNGVTWSATAADPCTTVSLNLMTAAYFEIAAGLNRKLVIRGTAAGTALHGFYSDDQGASWTDVVIGATLAEAATGPKSLFAYDWQHIWLGTSVGDIYFSNDGGATWTLQDGTIFGGTAVNAIHGCDPSTLFAVGAGDKIAKTVDGGVHWTICTATGLGDDLLSVFCFTKNRLLVGTSGAAVGRSSLLISFDGGVTYADRDFTGHDAEKTSDMDFSTPSVGLIVTNTAGLLGSVHQTIDGGMNWKELTVPANSGLNAVKMCGVNEAFVVGEANGGTAVILHVSP